MRVGVSLVVPVFNEEENLPGLFFALESQTVYPEEIIFVDAGSQDKSVTLIEIWFKKMELEGCSVKIIVAPDSFPGRARNIGVKQARAEFIAFLDVGVVPENEWLQESVGFVTDRGLSGAFGMCHFYSKDNFISKVICVLSD